MLRGISIVVLVLLAGAVGTAPHAAADTQTARTWAGAAQLAGPDGSLWQPTYRAGLKRSGPITVVQETYESGKAMGVLATFGNNTRGFTILQTYDGYQPALDAEPNRSAAPVGTFTVRLGDPDTSIAIRAQVSANCYLPKDLLNPPPPPVDFRCTKADVKRYGATLTMTARPPSTMTAPGTTDVVIQSRGITFKQLMRIASGLQQIMG
jgi:hypothetical protein